MELPEGILAHIFAFLPLEDKVNASMVCKTWSSSLTWPSAWRYTDEIRCDSKDCVPQKFFDVLPYIRQLKLSVSGQDAAHQESALWVLRQTVATGNGQLHGLCISYLEDIQMSTTDQGLLQGMVDVFQNGSSLKALDLRGIPFILKHQFVKSIARLCPALKSLFINNNSPECGVSSETVEEILECCPLLNTIGLFQASVSDKVLRDLMKPHKPELKLLELRCDEITMYVTLLCDEIWDEMRRRHPGLRMNVEFDDVPSDYDIFQMLKPFIPMRPPRSHVGIQPLDDLQLALHTYQSMLEELGMMIYTTSRFYTRLETLPTEYGITIRFRRT